MSKEYDEYLKGHIGAVRRAANWMLDNLDATKRLTDLERRKLIVGVRVHDASKTRPMEYVPYDNYFYGDGDRDAFNLAWLHHVHENPHHWQYWLLVMDDGKVGSEGKLVALEMPEIFALEMIADWWSFSWRSGDLTEVFGWYDAHRDAMILHPSTREYVEATLAEIRKKLEAEA